jgi:hypothetical protein
MLQCRVTLFTGSATCPRTMSSCRRRGSGSGDGCWSTSIPTPGSYTMWTSPSTNKALCAFMGLCGTFVGLSKDFMRFYKDIVGLHLAFMSLYGLFVGLYIGYACMGLYMSKCGAFVILCRPSGPSQDSHRLPGLAGGHFHILNCIC